LSERILMKNLSGKVDNSNKKQTEFSTVIFQGNSQGEGSLY